jgi:hypothetical protein
MRIRVRSTLCTTTTAHRSAPATAPASWPACANLAIAILRLADHLSIVAARRYHAPPAWSAAAADHVMLKGLTGVLKNAAAWQFGSTG